MIEIDRRNSAAEALIWTEEPNIYMDTWALTTFARDQSLQQQFLSIFADRGTLMMSVMLAVEIGANAAAEWPEMRALLDAIGPRWIPLTIDPFAVIDAQERGLDQHRACISSEFVTDRTFAAKLLAGDLSLGNVVDLTRGQDGIGLKAATDNGTAVITTQLAKHRVAHKADPQYLNREWKTLSWDSAKYMRPIYNAFVRQCVKDSFPLTDNHARDLFHAIASVGCAQMTLLDAHWAEQARKVLKQLRSPLDFVKVYGPKDVPQFLADLSACPRTRGSAKPPGL